MSEGRIFFKGNPYPEGHKVMEFVWDARLDKERGLVMDFHLESDDYYAEDHSGYEEKQEIEKSDWESKIVWCNYHKCILSSTYWSGNGFRIGTKQNKFSFGKLQHKSYTIDSIQNGEDYDHDELAFNIYLLGHDDCANHRITFVKQYGNYTFDIEWIGKIALAYAGEYEFKYSFDALINKVNFRGIKVDKTLSNEANINLLNGCLIESSDFNLVGDRFVLK